jgi:hypothetical protein
MRSKGYAAAPVRELSLRAMMMINNARTPSSDWQRLLHRAALASRSPCGGATRDDDCSARAAVERGDRRSTPAEEDRTLPRVGVAFLYASSLPAPSDSLLAAS